MSFRTAFRIGRGCFDLLCGFIDAKWLMYYATKTYKQGRNQKNCLKEKVAITLCYFGSRGSMEEVSLRFGVSKSTVSRAITQIMCVLYGEREHLIFYLRSHAEWCEVSDGFELLQGNRAESAWSFGCSVRVRHGHPKSGATLSAMHSTTTTSDTSPVGHDRLGEVVDRLGQRGHRALNAQHADFGAHHERLSSDADDVAFEKNGEVYSANKFRMSFYVRIKLILE